MNMDINKLKTFEEFEPERDPLLIEDTSVPPLYLNTILDNYHHFIEEDRREEYINLINGNYTGYVYWTENISPEEKNNPYRSIAYIKNYTGTISGIYCNYSKIYYPPIGNSIEFPFDSSVLVYSANHSAMLRCDKLIKLKEIPENNPKVRWYKKGKFEKSNEGVRWYKGGKLTNDPEFYKEKKSDDDFITDSIFKNFLIKKGALEEYKKFIRDKYKKDFDRISGREAIDNAFYWDETDSGYEYWADLHDEWIDLYNENRSL